MAARLQGRDSLSLVAAGASAVRPPLVHPTAVLNSETVALRSARRRPASGAPSSVRQTARALTSWDTLMPNGGCDSGRKSSAARRSSEVSQTAPKTSRPHSDVVSDRCGLSRCAAAWVRLRCAFVGVRRRFVGASRTRRERRACQRSPNCTCPHIAGRSHADRGRDSGRKSSAARRSSEVSQTAPNDVPSAQRRSQRLVRP